MDTPLIILKKEHKVARNIVRILSSIAKLLLEKKPVSLIFMRDLTKAVGKTMTEHHRKEMEIFAFLTEKAEVGKKELLEILIGEHNLGDEYLANMLRIINLEKHGEKEKYELLPFHCEKYSRLLDEHIEKEEDDFFPLIKAYIGNEDQGYLSDKFAKIEKETHSQGALTFISEAGKRYL